MNKKTFLKTLPLGCVLVSTSAYSRPDISLSDSQIEAKAASHRIVYVDNRPSEDQVKADRDSVTRLVAEYYYEQFRNSQDPDMPYFLFMSKGAGLTLGVGGGVRMRAYCDWNGAQPTTAFSPFLIPMPENPASRSKFNATPSGTYLNMRMIGHSDKIGSYGLYIEADFTGYEGRDFRLKKSYAMIGNWTAGYATSTFSDPAALPPVVDAAGPNNKFTSTNVLVRYMARLKQRWYVGASVETPTAAVNVTDGLTKGATDWIPDVAALLQYEWAMGQHVRLSGIVRSLPYMTIADMKRHNVTGWGVQISSVAHPIKQWTTYMTVNYGQGYEGLGGDLMYGAYDLVPSPANPARLYAPSALGWCAGVQFNFKPNIFATLSASQTHYIPRAGSAGNEYRNGTFVCGNVFWSVLPRLTVACEYDWGQRRNIDHARKAASRANVTAIFSF